MTRKPISGQCTCAHGSWDLLCLLVAYLVMSEGIF